MTGVDRAPGEVVLAPGVFGGTEIVGRIEVGRGGRGGGGRGGGGRGGGGRGRGGRGRRGRGGGGAVFVGPGYVIDDGPVILEEDEERVLVPARILR